MLVFTPLAGSAQSPHTRPLSYIIQVDDVRILLDCGSYPPDADPELAEQYYAVLQKEAPDVDLVLLSHGDLAHLGLFAYAHSRWNLSAPAYASIPVQAMGRMAVVAEMEDILDEENLPLPNQLSASTSRPIATRNEIVNAFDTVSTLRYSEPIALGGKCQGITITPYNAGHTVGGTIWKIRSPTSGTIVYAVDINHTKERHLDGTVILRASGGGGVFEGLARPDLLITDADRTLITTPRRKDRDTAFLDIIASTLRTSHSILIPCDASTRILELLVLLDQFWSFQKLSHPICLVSHTGQEMLTYVRSMIEWMGGTVSKEEGAAELETGRLRRRRGDDNEDEAIGPVSLRFKHVRFYPTAASFLASPHMDHPKVILAVPQNLSHGSSRKLFTTFTEDPGNILLLTAMSEEGTLGHDLFGMWNERQTEADKWGNGRVGEIVRVRKDIPVQLHSKVPLTGQELEDHLTQERERIVREREAAQRAAMSRSQQLLEADAGDDSDTDSDSAGSSDDEMAVDKALGQPEPAEDEEVDPDRQLSFDIYLKGNVAKATSFFKSSTGTQQRFRMYPYVEKSSGGGVKRRVDEYGETLDVGLWLRRGRALDEDAESEEVKEAKRKKKEEEEAKKAPPEPPSKYVTEVVQVQLNCQLAYVDLEGLNDGRAIKTIIPQMNPRRMILVHSSSEASSALVQSCGSIRAMTLQIFAPATGESVTIGQQTKTFSISLADSLMASLKLSSFEDSEMAFLQGRVISHGAASLPLLEPNQSAASNTSPSETDSMDSAPPSKLKLTAAPLPRSTMIGDLKLTTLRSKLTSLGISAEFAGEGLLVCSGGGTGDLEQTVAVRKTGRGKISVEGATGDVYFTVRREIYALHAVVAQP